MKTLLPIALSIAFAIHAHAETRQEALDKAFEWVEQESARQESRAAQARQQAALEDIRWELEEQRFQAQANARARAIAQAEAALERRAMRSARRV